MPTQLTFNFPIYDEPRFENFYPGANAMLLPLLKNLAEQTEIFCAYLWGGVGTGKTHLLRAIAAQSPSDCVYLPLAQLKNESPLLLDAFSFSRVVCFDEVDSVAGNADWEEALFHFYHRVEANHGHLLFSSVQTPSQLLIQLPDLKSRLAGSFVMEIKPLLDEEKLMVLKNRAQARGFRLTEEVAEFLLSHCPRNMRELMRILEQLDQVSLTEKRRVTIPLVKKVL